MSSVKKLFCNPPAEKIATSGDARVAGMFEGAGDVLAYLDRENMDSLRKEMTERVLAVEMVYMQDRKELEQSTFRQMEDILNWIVSAVTETTEHKDGSVKQEKRTIPPFAQKLL